MTNYRVLNEEELMNKRAIRRQLTDVNVQKYYDFNQFKHKLEYH